MIVFTEKLVRQAHLRTLHGGLFLTMAEVREKYWIPRLRKLTKKVVKSCWGSKVFVASSFYIDVLLFFICALVYACSLFIYTLQVHSRSFSSMFLGISVTLVKLYCLISTKYMHSYTRCSSMRCRSDCQPVYWLCQNEIVSFCSTHVKNTVLLLP